MPEPTAALLALRASTADLVQGVERENWSDDDVRAPSLCEGWTRAHVLTHLARNADSIATTLSGALRGEVVARYPGGADGRSAAINSGASRTVSALLTDVVESAERLDRVLGAMRELDAWERPTGGALAAQDWVPRRVGEIEIHRVDLDGSYTPDRWPPLLISGVLPTVAETLTERVDETVRVEVVSEGSIVADLAGTVWTSGEGTPIEVRGPDWAVLAWLVGRGSRAKDSLTATPTLRPWR